MEAPAAPSRGVRLLRLLLLLAALDALLTGLAAVARPDELFSWLELPPTPDRRLLCRALGALTLTHVPCLVLAALRPRDWGGLLAVPLLGRALLAGVWLWLLHAERVHPAPDALHALLLHDVAWLTLFVISLVVLSRPGKRA